MRPKQKHRENCCHSLKGRLCFLFFFLLLLFFSSIPHLLWMSACFLHLFYSPLFAFRFFWLLFSPISQDDHPGSAALWQLRVHYFCLNWKCKCCLHFIVNYSWKGRSVWLCLHCWIKSLPYSLGRIWMAFPWSDFHTYLIIWSQGSVNPMIYNSTKEIEGLPKNTCNVLCVTCMFHYQLLSEIKSSIIDFKILIHTPTTHWENNFNVLYL